MTNTTIIIGYHYKAFNVYVTALPLNFDITNCNTTTFMCKSRLQCVAELYRCDNSLQCHDGSDEYECDYYYWSNGNVF